MRERTYRRLQCPRESDFLAMHRADAEKQVLIREENPEGAHCRFLVRCPAACWEFPETVVKDGATVVEAGSPCPNNPFEEKRTKAMLERVKEFEGLLAEADRMGDLVELGLLPGLMEITPEELAAARIVRARRRLLELRLMSGAGGGSSSVEE